MKIGFDAKKAVRNLTGIGNYSRRCVNALLRYGGDVVPMLYTAVPGKPEALAQLETGCRVVLPSPLWRKGLLGEWWRCRRVCRDIRRQQLDIYHGLSNELPFGIQKTGCKSVVTIHDLIFLKRPDTYGFWARHILQWKTRYACRVADRIVAISETTRRDLMEMYGVEKERIALVYQSISPAFSQQVSEAQRKLVREKYRLPERYILCVGTIEKRKNQLCLVRALAELADEVHLVLVGRRTPYLDEVIAEAERLHVSGRVHILHAVSSQDLPVVYRLASVFCLMSVYEGFGLPVAEALASGVPVVAATGSCLEEAGGPDSVYLAPHDVQGVSAAIRSILSNQDYAEKMVRQGREYVKRFSDQTMAEGLLELYRSLINA